MWIPKENNRFWRDIACSSNGTKIAAVADNDYIYISDDGGETWTQRGDQRTWMSIAISDDGLKIAAVAYYDQIHISNDGGISWSLKDSIRLWRCIDISGSGDKLIAASEYDTVYISSDGGENWTSLTNANLGHNLNGNADLWLDVCISNDGYTVAAVDGIKLYISHDFGNSWNISNISDAFTSVDMSGDGNKIITSGFDLDQPPYFGDGKIYISSDGGENWVSKEGGQSWWKIKSSNDGDILIAGDYFGGSIFVSTDGGDNWLDTGNFFPPFITDGWIGVTVSDDGTKLAACVSESQIYIQNIVTITTTTTTTTTTKPCWTKENISKKQEYNINSQKPCDPFLNVTTSTTTSTTPIPTLEYYSLPDINAVCPSDPCICGSIQIPSHSYIDINGTVSQLTYESSLTLDKEQTFVTTTKKLSSSLSSTNSINLIFQQQVNIINAIKVVIKIRETKKIIGQVILGSFDSFINLTNINIPLIDTFNLSNLTLQIEISSLCKQNLQTCCDTLPSNITLTNVVSDLYCTTTPAPLSEFCSHFDLPDSFYMTIKGYGVLDKQYHFNIVTRNGNTWTTTGAFPCGAQYSLSMTCNTATQKFTYDGYIDCCNQSTKSVIAATNIPYLSPETISPLIISYSDCSCNQSCIDFPTDLEEPEEPPIDNCEIVIEVLEDGSEIIQNVNNIFGIGEICCSDDCTQSSGGTTSPPTTSTSTTPPPPFPPNFGDDYPGGGGTTGTGTGGQGYPPPPATGCTQVFKEEIAVPANLTVTCDKYWAGFNNIKRKAAIDAWNRAPFYRTANGKQRPISEHPTHKSKDCWNPNPVKKFTTTKGMKCNGKCYYYYWYECRPKTKPGICVSPPTIQPPLPPKLKIRCEESNSFTIQGYAFYTNTASSVNINGQTLNSTCFGGHICDNATFIPILKTKNKQIVAEEISLNNGDTGDNKSQTFSFQIDDASILKDGATLLLQCKDICHNNPTWLILTATIDNQDILLFNRCLFPDEEFPLTYKCIDCCDWDGNGVIEFSSMCSENPNQRFNLKFVRYGDTNLWEASQDIDCGDNINWIIECDPNIIIDQPTEELCKQKWKVKTFRVPCANNFRLTGNLLELCTCDSPPVFEGEADDFNNCFCCAPPCRISQSIFDYLGTPYNPNCSAPGILQHGVIIPEQYNLPILINIRGYVNDDLLIDGQSITTDLGYDPGPYPDTVGAGCVGAHDIGSQSGPYQDIVRGGITFPINKRSFVVACRDSIGAGATIDITITINPLVEICAESPIFIYKL